jgi:tRNA-dihydrouridine synthase A
LRWIIRYRSSAQTINIDILEFSFQFSAMTLSPDSHRFCVAPMLDWTDRHERYFLRQISRHARLYTEMVTTGALLHGDIHRHLSHDSVEHPLALQLGGSVPEDLMRCAHIAQEYGYDEINLNVGCPSDRVQSGRFGACLMADAPLVAACVRAMKSAVDLPVTVKCRTGIDEQDSSDFLEGFVSAIADAGCDALIIHARIAILKGLSPKENREIPPLNYERVYLMKEQFPQLKIILNGGVKSIPQAQEILAHVDGVMMGREAYHNPWILHDVDASLFGDSRNIYSRMDAIRNYLPYVEQQLSEGTPLQHMTRHILGLFHGVPGGKAFRRHLSENAFRRDAGLAVLEDAIAKLAGYTCVSVSEELTL